MLITKRMLLALMIVGALVGGGLGVLVTRSASSDSAKATSAGVDTTQQAVSRTDKTPDQIATENGSQFRTSVEQAAYRQGFDEGYTVCSSAQLATPSRTLTSAATYRTPARRSANERRVYYDYGNQPRGRSFWQKHRDKLTLAIGTGAGATVGGLVGGKRGAGIGSLLGLGSSALYTYKIRQRSPRRY